ncbi:YktB family protein [Chengkuizengella axinellae]|uniref:UPF0637 protein Q5Y73_04230 n=1 Tax=Chengkuizengella axinellae TaxID=3064388 RepID=A0ABT9IWW0_9BACL|nr:DUF1054 domain-containing protein [Chengkuizengella sp. 2205SS18-9]MDP5273299.1 DUF1054 domain-containing protein [Chengkuizengella sp. 2205SS18-9]
MNFQGFTKEDFHVFTIDGLEPRMEALIQHVRPKLEVLGTELASYLSAICGEEMFPHVAKHARRKVNPPNDTWVAWANNKRGYKAHPHFQVGLFDDHLFIWLALIYELPNKKNIAQNFINNVEQVQSIIPTDYVISLDHMKKESIAMNGIETEHFIKHLERFRDVKKAELLIGRHIQSDDPILQNGQEFMQFIEDTMKTLLPLYKMSFE